MALGNVYQGLKNAYNCTVFWLSALEIGRDPIYTYYIPICTIVIKCKHCNIV